jgi:hypothetical protein
MARAVERLGATEGYTSLAIGADQLFAEHLVAAGVPFVAVVPCAAYDATFSESELVAYRRLLAEAGRVEVLPFPKPSEDAFLAAGKRVVDASDALLAVWDGEDARGRGGTGDIVAYALRLGRPVLHMNPVDRTIAFIGSGDPGL